MTFKARTTRNLGAHMVGHPLAITSIVEDDDGDFHVEAYLITSLGGEVRLRTSKVVVLLRTMGDLVANGFPEFDLEAFALGQAQVLLADHLAELETPRLAAAASFGSIDFTEAEDSISSQLITRHVRSDLNAVLDEIAHRTQDRDLRRILRAIKNTHVPR